MRTHFGAIWEAIADAVPQQAAVVQGDRRVGWRDYEQRAARMAQALLDAGWSVADIVTLSQLVSFLAFQLRVVAGLQVLKRDEALVTPAREALAS